MLSHQALPAPCLRAPLASLQIQMRHHACALPWNACAVIVLSCVRKRQHLLVEHPPELLAIACSWSRISILNMNSWSATCAAHGDMLHVGSAQCASSRCIYLVQPQLLAACLPVG